MEAVDRTRRSLEAGAEIKGQGAFRSGDWGRRTDILRRIERPSALAEWSFQPR